MTSLFRSVIAGLSERERRLVMGAGVVFVVLVVAMAVFFVQTAIGDLEIENKEREDLLRLIIAKEPQYLENQRKTAKMRRKGQIKPTPLRTLVDKIGTKLAVTVPDIKELPDQKHAGWIEHGVELSLREIGLLDLTRFMEEVEGNRTRFPIAITKIEVRKRRRAEDQFDIKMVISTFERAEETPPPNKRTGGTGRKGAR